MKQASQKLANGLSIVVFPEGTRSFDGNLLPFKRGGFVMAQNAGAAIVPITIKGSIDRLPRAHGSSNPAWWKLLSARTIPRQEAPSDSRSLAAQVQQIISFDLASVNNKESAVELDKS